MPKKTISSLRAEKKSEAVVDYKEKYKNKKRKEVPVSSQPKKKVKENARDPKEFICPYCKVTVTGWVVCRHHIFSKHGVVATRSDLLNNNLPEVTIDPTDADSASASDEEGSDEDEDELPRGLHDFSEEESGDEREEQQQEEEGAVDSDSDDGWIANALRFWRSHLRKIEDDADRHVSTQEIFDKNSKKKFRPEFMSKKEYVRHIIAAMKEDSKFDFDEKSSSFTLADVEDSEEDSEEEVVDEGGESGEEDEEDEEESDDDESEDSGSED